MQAHLTNMDIKSCGSLLSGRVTDEKNFHAIGQLQPSIEALVFSRFDHMVKLLTNGQTNLGCHD